MNITLSWWIFPTLITILSVGWAIFVYDDGVRGVGSGFGNVIMLVVALFISLAAWIVAAIIVSF